MWQYGDIKQLTHKRFLRNNDRRNRTGIVIKNRYRGKMPGKTSLCK